MLDKATREELIQRINALDDNSKPQWGKMNIYQMLKHCTMWDEMVLKNKKYDRVFLGRIFGRMALKGALKDASPMTRNAPTIPALKVTDNGDASAQKRQWIAMIDQYGTFSHPIFMHPFFGKMTQEQIGCFAYKHTDHHLRQFNV